MTWIRDDQAVWPTAQAEGFMRQQPTEVSPQVRELFPFGDVPRFEYVVDAMWLKLDKGAITILDYDFTDTRMTTVTRTDAYHRPYTENERVSTRYRGTLGVLRHPAIIGGAELRPDWRATGWGRFWNAFFWIPPLIIVKFVQLLMIKMMKLKKVGQPDFDRRFRITAQTNEAAQRAISPPLRARLLAEPIHGLLGLRDGAALIELKPGPGAAGLKKVSADLRALLAVLTAPDVWRG